MTVTEKTGPPHALTAAHHHVDASREEIEEVAAEAPGILLRGFEVGMVVFIGLLVCPPLAILAVVVVVPLLAIAIVVGLLAAIVAVPYLLVRHVREHHRTHRSSAFAHALRRPRAREA
jgi:Flp pilus assembly protein TadB